MGRVEELRLIEQFIREHGVTVLPPFEEKDKRSPAPREGQKKPCQKKAWEVTA